MKKKTNDSEAFLNAVIKAMGPRVYIINGFPDRESYLQSLADDYGLDLEKTVKPLADLLGPEEDFDMLVERLEEIADENGDLI